MDANPKRERRGINNNLKEMAQNHADHKIEYPLNQQSGTHENKIDESSPEYQKAWKRIHEIESSLRHYESKLCGAFFDLDMGLPGKTNAEYFGNRINELKKEQLELESKAPKHYSKQEIGNLENSISHNERNLYAMKNDQELFGISYANQLSFYDYKINDLKQELRKARKFQG